MKILIIGYSSLVRRRILPYLNEIPDIDSIDIAKYHLQKDETVNDLRIPFRIFNSYEEAIEKSDAGIAYISTTNQAHDLWAKKALERRMHVIVDKPAFSSLNQTLDLVKLSEKKDLGLAEATVYSYHSQLIEALKTLAEYDLKPTDLTINFAFPELGKENFRYRKSLGGGALNDLGPYLVSAGRIFFNDLPEHSVCQLNSFSNYNYPDNVESSFSALLKYSNGRSLVGQFSFNSEYINRIYVSGTNFSLEINRAFTPPCDVNNEVIFRMNNKSMILQSGLSNSFVNFLNDFISAIKQHEFSKFRETLLQDSKALEILRSNVIITTK